MVRYAVSTALIKKIASELDYSYRYARLHEFGNNKGLNSKKAELPSYTIKNIISSYSVRLLRNKEKLPWRK